MTVPRLLLGPASGRTRSASAALAILLASGCAQESPLRAPPEVEQRTDLARGPADVDGERIRSVGQEPGSWPSHGRDYGEQRFSPLSQIRTETVDRLGLAWSHDLGTRRGLEATPIAVDGVLYATATWSVVFALDAASGALLWRHDPGVPRERARFICCDVVNRGVAVWKGAVYAGTLDGRLLALDAATGRLLWQVQTVDLDRPYAITGAPRILPRGDVDAGSDAGLVIIGNGGADLGVRGYVSAYDSRDGSLLWRFYTVPGDPAEPQESDALELAVLTWSGDVWVESGGGGTVWDSIAYDAELDLLYVGTGNGSPWSRAVRSPEGGDNLYLSSILALRAATGELVWHYQTTPGDNWDFTATQHMILADLEIGGRLRRVLMQAPKNGFFYVLDRETGELLSAEPFARVTWAERVDLATGRPVESGAGDYSAHPVSIYPGSMGAHNWHPMAFHPGTGLVYIPAQEVPGYYAAIEGPFRYEPGSYANAGVDFTQATSFPREYASGSLDAWDVAAGRRAWRVSHTTAGNGGVLATDGNLVFQGTADGRFVAYRADTGERMWERAVGTGVIAAPISYEVDGRQYVAVLAGWGGAFGLAGGDAAAAAGVRSEGRVLAFALDGRAELPRSAPARPRPDPPPPPPLGAHQAVERGSALYAVHCSACHGVGAVAGGVLPDLRFLRPEARDAFTEIVVAGSLESAGMPGFGRFVDAEGAGDILLYLADRARAGFASP